MNEQMELFRSQIEVLREQAGKPPRPCPRCGVPSKVYRRPMTASSAAILTLLAVTGEQLHIDEIAELMHLPNGEQRRFGILHHWGLVERVENEETRKRTSGVWKATPWGIRFAKNPTNRAPSHVFLRSPGDTFLGFEETTVTVLDALRDQFDYPALMRGEWG